MTVLRYNEVFESVFMGGMGSLGDMGEMGSEARKIISEQNKISSTLFKISSEQIFFISELFSLVSGSKKKESICNAGFSPFADAL